VLIGDVDERGRPSDAAAARDGAFDDLL